MDQSSLVCSYDAFLKRVQKSFECLQYWEENLYEFRTSCREVGTTIKYVCTNAMTLDEIEKLST